MAADSNPVPEITNICRHSPPTSTLRTNNRGDLVRFCVRSRVRSQSCGFMHENILHIGMKTHKFEHHATAPRSAHRMITRIVNLVCLISCAHFPRLCRRLLRPADNHNPITLTRIPARHRSLFVLTEHFGAIPFQDVRPYLCARSAFLLPSPRSAPGAVLLSSSCARFPNFS